MRKDISKKKKRMLVCIVVVCIAAVIGLVFLEFEDKITDTEDTAPAPSYQGGYSDDDMKFYHPDWETNIFEYEPWLEKNRYITYKEGGMSTVIADDGYGEYGIEVEFMSLYFKALMHGDADALCGFYSDAYLEANGRFDKFTMQKVYDIVLERIDAKDNTGDSVYVYKVSYKILENDGTFRDDVLSDGVRAQYYTIVDDGYELKITDVSYTYNK